MPANQANVEYWFRLLYECFHGTCYGTTDFNQLVSWLSHLWLWITVIGYVLSVLALGIVIYCVMQLFELRKREHEYYHTLIQVPDSGGANSRWQHIQELVNGTTPSEWREAIIEADIMLDDLLTKEGYVGESLGERLKNADISDFKTLSDAWEAHKVRNQIAHQGSSFDLTESLSRRTIAQYRNVFDEFKVI